MTVHVYMAGILLLGMSQEIIFSLTKKDSSYGFSEQKQS